MRHLSQSYSESQKITSNHSQESILVTNLNQSKEKAIKLSFGHEQWHDNSGIKWNERLRPPKCDKIDVPQVRSKSFPNC